MSAIVTERYRPTRRMVIMFFSLAFAISWAIWSPLIFFPERSDQLTILPAIGSFGPILAAILTNLIYRDAGGLRQWLRSVFRWRIPFIWYMVGGLLLAVLQALLHVGLVAALGGDLALAIDPPWYYSLVAFPLNVIIATPIGSGMGEEPGWRGFALPALLEHLTPLSASIALGAIWGIWHTPLLLSPGWSGRGQGLWLLIYVIPLSIIYTWLYRKSRGSAIPVILLHSSGNLYSSRLVSGSIVVLGTVLTASPMLDFTILKTIIYSAIALVIILATKGRLGYGQSAERLPQVNKQVVSGQRQAQLH